MCFVWIELVSFFWLRKCREKKIKHQCEISVLVRWLKWGYIIIVSDDVIMRIMTIETMTNESLGLFQGCVCLIDFYYQQRCWQWICVQSKPPRWRKGRSFASHTGDRGSIPGRDKPKSLKQVMTAPLPNARQQVWVSRILQDDHYKG